MGSFPFLFPAAPRCDMSISTYADDITREICVPQNTIQTQVADMLKQRIIDATHRFSRHLESRGYTQNEDKMKIVLSVKGRGALNIAKKLTANTEIAPYITKCARYLSPMIMNTQSMTAERPRKIQAVRRGWNVLPRFWRSATAWKLKAIVFRAAVFSPALVSRPMPRSRKKVRPSG